MSFINWVIDSLSSDDVIDLYFIVSDLVDIHISETERCETSARDARAGLANLGYEVRGGHVFENGVDRGPVGKFVG